MLIGLTGRLNSGKDHIFTLIQEDFPDAQRIAFGDVLKAFVSELFGFTVEDINALKRKDTPVCGSFTMRQILQNTGMAVRHVLKPDIWVDKVLPLTFDHMGKLVVVTDVRMDNEARRIKDLYGVIWQVEREPHDYEQLSLLMRDTGILPVDDHETEQGISYHLIDGIISNTTDEACKFQLKELFEQDFRMRV